MIWPLSIVLFERQLCQNEAIKTKNSNQTKSAQISLTAPRIYFEVNDWDEVRRALANRRQAQSTVAECLFLFFSAWKLVANVQSTTVQSSAVWSDNTDFTAMQRVTWDKCLSLHIYFGKLYSWEVGGGWVRKPVLGKVLRHLLGRHVPEHVLEHMPWHVLKHVPDRPVSEYVLKHVLKHMLDKHVLNRMAHAVLMT